MSTNINGPSRSFTKAEAARHATEGDLWTIVNGNVYDLSKFLEFHPGGAHVLLDSLVAGRDSSATFFSLHRSSVLAKYSRYIIGTCSDSPPSYLLPIPGELSPVPYAEPSWLTKQFSSPYFNDSHRKLQRAMRDFFDTEVQTEAREREESHERPSERVVRRMGEEGVEIHAMRMGPGKHLIGRSLLGGVKPEEFDYLHEMVVIQELVRIGAPGYMAGLQAGMVIGLPPVLNYGTEKMKAELLPDILSGKKFISLAISEAGAGSDVRNMTTWARKTPCGKFYEVTGAKKWITNGHFSDFFMVGVRTSSTALSMLLIPRVEGVETKIIKTSYSHAAGTAYVSFDKVLVPVENLLGKEHEGLKVILSNFNHERIVICARIARYSRMIYEESFKWAHLRMAFGKPLIEQPVVRQKFAHMLAKVEAGQSWLESLVYQMCSMSYDEQSQRLAGPIALLKLFLSKSAGEISDDAVQIWGGRGITKAGMGIYIEQFQRTYKFDSVLGGSEEVLADLGIRQAMKSMPKAVL